MQAHLVRASEVKKAIEWIMCRREGHYAANTVAAALAVGAAAAEPTPATDSHGSNLLAYSSIGDARDNDATRPSDSSGDFRLFLFLLILLVEYL